MRRYASKLLVVAMVSFTIASGEATAVPIPVLFEITAIGGTGLGTNTATATGTSNGIAWVLSETYISGCCTLTDDSFGGFNVLGKHVPQIAATDNLHLGRLNFTLTFDVAISSMLVYIGENLCINADPSNNQTCAPGLDFGIVPTMSGPYTAGDVTVSGTRFGPTSVDGGTVLIDDIYSTTLTHTATGPFFNNDINFAFFVTPVPEPSTLVLLAIGFAGIVIYTRYREQMNGKGQSLKANG